MKLIDTAELLIDGVFSIHGVRIPITITRNTKTELCQMSFLWMHNTPDEKRFFVNLGVKDISSSRPDARVVHNIVKRIIDRYQKARLKRPTSAKTLAYRAARTEQRKVLQTVKS